MLGIRKINSNPAEQTMENFMAATNAVAEQNRQRGLPAEFLSAANAKETHKKLIKTAVALANPAHEKHNAAFNALKEEFGHDRTGLDLMHDIGSRYLSDSMTLAQSAQKAGMAPEAAVDFAFNSLAGNPVFDHFGNLNLLGGQLFEEMAVMQSFLDSGDAFAVPEEAGGTGLNRSRFRAPVEQVMGSAKVMQGDINPIDNMQDDHNRTQISLYNEFKNAETLSTVFSITQAMRDQALGYAKAVAPALAGFLLQNRYFGATQKQVMKLAEIHSVFGQDAAGSYTPGVGGSYGLLSSAIQLQLADWAATVPAPATPAQWLAAPTKLVQKIQNAIYKPTSTSAALDISVDPSLMYKEIVRLLMLFAQQNVDFGARLWRVLVPTSWYGLASQYPGTQAGTGQGTFNRTLDEMVRAAVGGKIIPKIDIVPSSLMNYGAANGRGGTNSYNYIVAMAMGCRQELKPVIMPGQTAVPYVTSENVSATIMNFRTQFSTGGPMFMHYGGAAVLEISAAA